MHATGRLAPLPGGRQLPLPLLHGRGEPACSTKAASRAWELLFRAQRARNYRDVARSRPRRRWSSRYPSSASAPSPSTPGPLRSALPQRRPLPRQPSVCASRRRAPRSAALEHRDWRRGGAGSAHQQPALRPVRRAVPAPDTALGSLVCPRRAFLGEPVPHPLRSLGGRYRPRASQPAGTRLTAPLPPLSPRRSAQPAHRRRSLARRLMNM